MNHIEKFMGPNHSNIYKYEHVDATKTTVYSINASKATSLRFPPTISDSFNISHKYLVIQIFRKIGDNYSIALNFKNNNGKTQKIFFSTTQRSQRASSNSFQNIINAPVNKWVNLCFDLPYVVQQYWPGNEYNTLINIEISPSCFIRWIFAAPNQLKPSLSGSDLPNTVAFNALESQTLLIGEEKNEISSKTVGSKIPIYNRKKNLSNTATTPGRPKRVEDTKPASFAKNPLDDESDVSSDDAFSSQPSTTYITDGDELELVYIDALDCYYCPANQKYYTLLSERN